MGESLPRYYFDFKNGHTLADPSKIDSMSQPSIRNITSPVIDDEGQEIFKVPVYSKPAAAQSAFGDLSSPKSHVSTSDCVGSAAKRVFST